MSSLTEVAKGFCESRNLVLQSDGCGEGAFKQTFLARNSGGEELCVKVHKPEGVSLRVEREIKALLACNHPDIAQLESVEVFRTGGGDFLISVEPYIEGGSLQEKIEADGLLPLSGVMALAAKIGNCIRHIADKGLVHRDLKPANIMLRGGCLESPVLIDFGLVRNLGDSSLTQTFLSQGPGTPLYASPEQLNNEKALIDWRSDQFSLGVMIAICVKGLHPYQPEGTRVNVDLIERVAGRGAFAQWFDDWTSELPGLRKCVAPWPVERFRSHDKLIECLEALS